MLQNMGPQSPLLLEKPALQMLPSQQQTLQPANGKTQAPLSPLDSLVQLQLIQRNSLLISPNVELTKTHPRLDRSISEPYRPQDLILKGQSSHQSNKNVLNPNRYKTEMCRPFVENGYCKYGDKCQFAHGAQEQRSVPRHPKYKTEYCKTFHTTGICPYGPRCHFIHNEDETKLGEISNMKRQQAAVQAAQEMAKQAAQIQLQHQLLQSQLQSLVSQVNQQLISQLGVQSVPSVASSASPSATQPLSIQRPRLTHSISVHPTLRGFSMGSTADTPPESLSTSPVLSPTFTHSEDSISDSLSDSISGVLTPPVCGDLNSSFSFPVADTSPVQMSPQKPVPSASQETTPSITSLSESLQALALSQNVSQSLNYTTTNAIENITENTSTNLDSLSPQISERNRLPIFNQIVGL